MKINVRFFVFCLAVAALIITGCSKDPFRNRRDAAFSPHGAVSFDAVIYSADGKYSVKQIEPYRNGNFGLFDAKQKELIREINLPISSNSVKGMAFAPNSRWLAVMYHVSSGGSIYIVDVETAKLLKLVKVDEWYHFMVFDRVSNTTLILATASGGYPAKPYTYLEIEVNGEEEEESDPFTDRSDAAFSPRGTLPTDAVIYSVDGKYSVKQIEPYRNGNFGLFDAKNNQLIRKIRVPVSNNDAKGMAFAPNSRWLAVMYHVSSGGSIYIVDVETGVLLKSERADEWYHFMVFDRVSNTTLILATVSGGYPAKPYTYLELEFAESEGEIEGEGEVEKDPFVDRSDAVFSPHGSVPNNAVIYSADGTYYLKQAEPYKNGFFDLFDAKTNEKVREIDLPIINNNVKGMAFSPDSSLLAIMYHAGSGSSIYLVEVQTGDLIQIENIIGWYHFMVFDRKSSTTLILATAAGARPAKPYTYLELEFSEEGEQQVEIVTVFQRYTGSNLPWIRYGHDIGPNPYGDHDGFSSVVGRTDLNEDFAFLASKGVGLVRVFIFCDFRTGLIDDGCSFAFDPLVYADMNQLLVAAEKFGLLLMPVLFDFHIANGVEYENGNLVGERPDLLTNRKEEFLFLLAEFLQYYGSNPSIYCWDIMNEPEYVSAVSQEEVKLFCGDVVALVHEYTDHLVTVGSKSWQDVGNWQGIGLDLYQFHYYDWMAEIPPVADLGLEKPVIVGEIQPTNITAKMSFLENNGYQGILFWSLNANYSFRDVADEFAAYFYN